MKLEINLDDREEIGAAIPLLQMIYDSTMHGEVSLRVPKATAAAVAANPQGAAQALADAAAPLAPAAPVAPSIAGAVMQHIAPEAAPVSSTLPPVAPAVPAPMPAPVAVAPSAPAAPMTPANDVELDSKGLPWDERIHASTKTKVADGTWKAKRGINDPALVARVEAELRARIAAPAPAAEHAPAMDAAAVFGGAVAPAPLPPAAIVPPAAPSLPAAPAAPSVGADPTTFEQLMSAISPLVVAGKLPPTATNQAATANGLANIVALQTQPAFVPLVWATIKQMYPAAFA